MRHRLAAFLTVTAISASAFAAGNWPTWRGPNRDDISPEKGLLKEWPAEGPKMVWMFDKAGIGYSGYSIVGDRLYTMGGRDDVEQLICVDTTKGAEAWKADIGKVLNNNWGDGPRGTPAVDGDMVYALGGQGTLIAASTKDGKIAWQKSLTKDLGGGTPGWGYTESVLVDGDKVLCTPGGKKGAVAALDKKTGDVKWQSSEFTDGAQYASIIAIEYGGKRQYVQLTMKTLVGLDAETGKVLWKSSWPGATAVIPTPIFKDGHVYISSGYGVGCKLVKLGDGGATDVYANKNMTNHHGGVILVGDHLYGYSDGKGWVCQDFKTGDIVWNEKSKLGKGAVAYADGMLYCVDEGSGTVALIEASPKGWSEKGRFKLSPQTKLRKPSGRVWTHPVITDGRLYLRDQELVYCFDVKDKRN